MTTKISEFFSQIPVDFKVKSGYCAAGFVTITFLALGVLALLIATGHSLGPFNPLGALHKIGGGLFVTLGSIGVIALGYRLYLKITAPTLEDKYTQEPIEQLTENSSSENDYAPPSQPTTNHPVIPFSNLQQDEIEVTDAVFRKPGNSDPRIYLEDEDQQKVKEDLKHFKQAATPPIGTRQPEARKLAQDQKIIQQLDTNYEIKERDGTSWGFDTVLFRGLHFPNTEYDTKGMFDTSMTSIVRTIFVEGMEGNGYVCNGDRTSTFYEDLHISSRHNWLVSTSFCLDSSCRYAANSTEESGVIFFIHAPQNAMKNELYGVNLAGGGKCYTEDGEIAFVRIPPEYIIGAVPITKMDRHTCLFHLEQFTPNPNAHIKINSVEEMEQILSPHDRNIFSNIRKDGWLILNSVSPNPDLSKANEQDRERREKLIYS